MFLGFVLATMTVIGASIKGSTTVAILVPIVALGVPIGETLLTMVRRFLERRPIFSPDRGHIHHRLLELGITHRRAVLILYGVSILFTGGAIAVAMGRNWEVGGALLVIAVVVLGIVRFVGYFEHAFLRRRQRLHFRSRSTEKLRRAVPQLLAEIRTAPDTDTLVSSVETFACEAELLAVELGNTEAPYHWSWSRDAGKSGGRETVETSYELPATGSQTRFAWLSDDGEVSPQADILLQLVADGLDQRLAEWHARPEARDTRAKEARHERARAPTPAE
jgi:UDP-GlcNAc:undecaprenyl-phosphate GlcNAc-1-phosphate transferase